MIHLYHGTGKGKTTAAMGLALRMAGRGRPVIIAQFLKGADSGERIALAALPQVTLLEIPDRIKFTFQLTPEERRTEELRCLDLLQRLSPRLADPSALLVLDEVCDAVNTGLLPEQALLDLLDRTAGEVVLTGRTPGEEVVKRADYITFFQKERHPFDKGVPARPGIEY